MQTSTADQAALVVQPDRDIAFSCTIGGSTTLPVVSYSVDREARDLPDQVSLLSTVAGVQAIITIAHDAAKALSPYQGLVPAALPLPIGATVVLSVTVGVGPDAGTWTVFTGYLVDLALDAAAEVTLRCLDTSGKLGGQVTINSAVAAPSTVDNGYTALTVAEAAMRQGGVYLCPAPSSTSKATRASYLQLSSSGCGGHLPDVGQLTTFGFLLGTWGQNGRAAGNWFPDVWANPQATMWAALAKPLTTYNQHLGSIVIDGWVQYQGGASGTALSVGSSVLQINGVGVNTEARWRLNALVGGGISASVAKNILDGAWHYVRAEVANHPALSTAYVKITVDGVSATTSMAYGTGYLDAQNNTDLITPDFASVITTGWASECVEVWCTPENTPTPGQDRSAWTAQTPSAMEVPTSRLRAIAGTTAAGWTIIQQLADAEGALAYFDELGQFRWRSQATWLASSIGDPVRTWDDDSLDNLPIKVSLDGLRRSVQAPVAQWTVGLSTVASPVYTATETLTAAPGTSVIQIATDNRAVLPLPYLITIAADPVTPSASYGYCVVVKATAVGDPAATIMTNVTVKVRPTLTGFELTVINPNPFAVAFWDPGTGLPVLVLHGLCATPAGTATVTAPACPSATDDLVLDANPWRQDITASQQHVTILASQTVCVIPELGPITVKGDPRLQLGDPVSVYASTVMQRTQTAVVTTIRYEAVTTASFLMTLGLRAAGAPTGTLLGVAGRAELHVSSYLPLAS